MLYKYITFFLDITRNHQKVFKNFAISELEHYVIRNELHICGIQPTTIECKYYKTAFNVYILYKQTDALNFNASAFIRKIMASINVQTNTLLF